MKLPRYPIARSATSELQSGRNAIISPAEAARSEMAKFNAVGSVVDAVGRATAVIADAKAEEEYTDGVTGYEKRISEVTAEMKNRKYEVDENGTVQVDAKALIQEEFEARREAAAEVRETMSGPARQKFDRYLVTSNIRRNENFRAEVNEIVIRGMRSQANLKIDTLIAENDYDGAWERAKSAAENGVFSQQELDAAKINISKNQHAYQVQGDNDYVYSELNDLQSTPGDLNLVVENLAAGKRGDGTPLTIDEKEKNILMGKVRTRMNSFEEDTDAQKKTVERESFFELYRQGLAGKLDLDTYMSEANRIGGFNAGYDKILRDMATGVVTDNFSTSDQLTYFRNRVNGLAYAFKGDDDDWKEGADNLLLEINQSDLSQAHKNEFSTQVTQDIKGLYNDPKYLLLQRKVYVDIAGFEEGMVASYNIEGKYDDQVTTAIDARIALLDEMERRGSSEDLMEWWEGTPGTPGKKAFFRAKLNADTIAPVMSRPVTFPADGVVDDEYLEEVRESMREFYQDTNRNNGTFAEREEDIETAITNFEKQTGIRLTMPVMKPIEVKTHD